jgi:hypothetical protein
MQFYLMCRQSALSFSESANLFLSDIVRILSEYSRLLVETVRQNETVALSVAIGIIGLAVLYRLIYFIRHFRFTLQKIRTFFTNLSQGIRTLFTRDFYRRISQNIDRFFGRLSYDVLIYIWEWASMNPYIHDSEKLRAFFHNKWERIYIWFQPIVKTVTRLLKRAEKTDPAKVYFSLMDEAKEAVVTSPAHIALQRIFDEDSAEVLQIPEIENKINECLSRWENDLLSGMLITGFPGNGKSSILKALNERYRGKYAVKYYAPDRGADLWKDAYFIELSNYSFDKIPGMKKSVIILDNMECLFTQVFDGFNGIQKLLLLIEKTKSRVLWIIACGQVFYQFYSKFSPLKDVFPYFLDLSILDYNQIADVLQWEINQSGYEFQYVPDSKLLKKLKKRIKRKDIDNREIQGLIRDEFFQRLYEKGLNNQNFFHFYFLKSIRNTSDKKVFMDMPEFLELKEAVDLSQTDLFILQAIILHNTLNKESLMEILNLDSNSASLRLSLLYEKNLIRKNMDGFSINPALAPQIIRLLKQKNLLNFLEERRN